MPDLPHTAPVAVVDAPAVQSAQSAQSAFNAPTNDAHALTVISSAMPLPGTGHHAPATAITFDEERLRILKETLMPGATEAELDFFKLVCQRVKLDPFAKQIHAVSRRTYRSNGYVTVWSYQTGIDGFRLIAQRTGEYRGQSPLQWCGDDGVWRDVWLSKAPPRASRAAILRAGFDEPMIAVAHYDEYVQLVEEYNGYGESATKTGRKIPNAMWGRMPAGQLAKCAEALAFRRAFPQELAGLYTDDEMGQADNARDDGPGVDRDAQQPARRESAKRHRAQTTAPGASTSTTSPTSHSAQAQPARAPIDYDNGTAPVFPYGPQRDAGVTLDAVYHLGATRSRKVKGKKGETEIVACGGEFVIRDSTLTSQVTWVDNKFAKHAAIVDANGPEDKAAGWLTDDDQARLSEWRDEFTAEIMRRAALLNTAAQSAAEDEQRPDPTVKPSPTRSETRSESVPAQGTTMTSATSPLSDGKTSANDTDDLPF